MECYLKADFSPPVLSRRWLAMKFRPNMLLYSRKHMICILESGLLFREDSAEVEQEAAAEALCAGRWLTPGEGALSLAALAACVTLFPPRRLDRWCLVSVVGYASVPLAVRGAARARCVSPLPRLLAALAEYIALARRAAAAIAEYTALYTQIESVMSVAESLHAALCRQQRALGAACALAAAQLAAAAPWLRGATPPPHQAQNLTQIHHTFLVMQSTLLKNIALAHCIPPPHIRKLYKNHNERIYYIHNTIVKELYEEVQENLQSLQRMYRLLKNSTIRNNDNKKLGVAVNRSWIYSDVHSGVARACLELKLALDKSNSIDMFMDSCAMHKEDFDLNVLNNDIDDLIDIVTTCLSTLQNSQLRLKKLRGKIEEQPQITEEKDLIENAAILKIEDKEPETRDEVFYFVKTEDDSSCVQAAGDLTSAPGQKEKETTKIVLSELKRKLGKREDLMRERERQALAKTMPDLKDVPEFPRQIKLDEYCDRKGYIKKMKRVPRKTRLFRRYKIQSKPRSNDKKYKMKMDRYEQESNIKGEVLEANSRLNVKSRLITVSSDNSSYSIVRWFKSILPSQSLKDFDSSGLSDGFSNEVGSENKTGNSINTNDMKIKFSKKDLELSASSSASDTEYYQEQRQLLKDVRRHRVARRKNHPNHRTKALVKDKSIDNVDESLKPIEYSFGAGLSMASVLQANNQRFLNMAQEEVFLGDGEVSNDSGNDEDA